MAQLKVQIVKRMQYLDDQQEFGNTYTVEGPSDEASITALITAIEAAEKAIHGIEVFFVRAACWEDNAVMANHMLVTMDLTGQGSATTSTSHYRPAALYFRARLPASFAGSRRTQRFLRKFIHATHNGGLSSSAATKLVSPNALMTAFAAKLNTCFNTQYQLVAPNGDTPEGSWEAMPYLVDRNLGR